jgi:hypothetical protein
MLSNAYGSGRECDKWTCRLEEIPTPGGDVVYDILDQSGRFVQGGLPRHADPFAASDRRPAIPWAFTYRETAHRIAMAR